MDDRITALQRRVAELEELLKEHHQANAERKSTQWALTQSEEKFRRLAEATAAALYIVKAGRYWYVNHYGEKLTGYKVQELVGKAVLELIHPDDQEVVSKQQQRSFDNSGQAVVQYEARLVTKSGEIRWVFISSNVFEMDGERSVIGVATDITDRKLAQEQLHKLMVAVEQSTSGVVITDASGSIEYVNRKFVEVTGYSSEEAKGQNPRILKSGEQGPEVYRELWDTIVSGREWRGEFHNKRKDGSLFWESAAISPIRDSSGVITNYLAIKDDITEWKKAQEELQFAHAQMIELFNSAPDAMSVIDTERTIILVNHTLVKLLGINKEEALGRKCYDFFQNDLCNTSSIRSLNSW